MVTSEEDDAAGRTLHWDVKGKGRKAVNKRLADSLRRLKASSLKPPRESSAAPPKAPAKALQTSATLRPGRAGFLRPADAPSGLELPTAKVHGHDLSVTEEACLGILKGVAAGRAANVESGRHWDDGSEEMERALSEGSSFSPAEPPTHSEDDLVDEVNAAIVDGVWKSDGSRHTVEGPLKRTDKSRGNVTVEARNGLPTLRVVYFFSGIERKASIANKLKGLCSQQGFGLIFEEIDILVGGASHDLLDKEAQERFIQRIESGDIDVMILSPPCGTWSRANWANDLKPQPCRDRAHPWGFPNQKLSQQKRADMGNEFVHFSIRALAAAKAAKARGIRIRSLLEHPEDLGMTHRGEPASIWQLPEIRDIAELTAPPRNDGFITVGGNQCQFPGVDRKKPTRLLSDLAGVERFGAKGWPVHDAGGWYVGPIPRNCGHGNHKQAMIGKNAKGGFNTAPTAAYPEGMCEFIADICFWDWVKSLKTRPPFGVGKPLGSAPLTPRARTAGQDSTPRGPSAEKRCAWDAPLVDPPGAVEGIISEEKIRIESKRLEELGTNRPIKDELELQDFAPKDTVVQGEATTE